MLVTVVEYFAKKYIDNHGVCQDRSKWKAVVVAYPGERKVYVCMYNYDGKHQYFNNKP